MDAHSLILPVPEDSARETAVSTGALGGVPRETVQRLARAYRIQRAG